MNILILGGAGFVGRKLAEFLAARYPKYHLTIVDNFSRSGREELVELEKRPSVEVIVGAIEDPELLPVIFEAREQNIIVNATFTNNVAFASDTFAKGTNNILSYVVSSDTQIAKYIHVSSDEVYGERSGENESETQPRLESDPLFPVHPVAAIQASGDLLATAYFRTFGIPTTVLRTSNTFGPNQEPSRLLPILIQHAVKNEDIPIFGDGTHTRDWLFVDDLVYAIDSIIQAPSIKTKGEVFNVSGDLELSVLEVTELILTILNRPKELVTFTEDKKPHHMRRVLDSGKILQVLDWRPEADVKQALEDTIRWYQNSLNTGDLEQDKTIQ